MEHEREQGNVWKREHISIYIDVRVPDPHRKLELPDALE